MQAHDWSRSSRIAAGITTLTCALICLQLASCSEDEPDKLAVDRAVAQNRAAAKRAAAPRKGFDARGASDRGTVSWGFEGEVRSRAEPILGWVAAETNGAGKPAKWAVVESRKALAGVNVLSLLTGNSGQTYNLFISQQPKLADLFLVCGIRANFGEEDQGGGPMWRLVDGNNYYVCRINPLEDNFRVYKVVDGTRTELASADFPSEAETWYRVRVLVEGDRIRCGIGEEWLLDVRDSTFTEPGKVGFWTKADASTSFDALMVSKAAGAPAPNSDGSETPDDAGSGDAE